jgi:hypothetical protein
MVDEDGFCTECGAAVSSTDKFCAGCGHNLGGTPPPPTSPPPPPPQAPRRNPVFPQWSWLVLIGAVLGFMMLSQCSGDDASSPGQETRAATTKAPTTTTMSLSEAWCSDLRKGYNPLQLYGGVKDDYPDVRSFASMALDMTRESCPSELESNESLRVWLQNWDLIDRTQPEAWCGDLRNGRDPYGLWLWVEDHYPDEEAFAAIALSWMESDCPGQLIENEVVQSWLHDWGLLETTSSGSVTTTVVATTTTTTEAPASPTTTLAFWRAELDRSDPNLMISVDRWIKREMCDDLMAVIDGLESTMERADPAEVRVLTELARYIFEGVEANVYLQGYECDYREDFVANREEWSERLTAAD